MLIGLAFKTTPTLLWTPTSRTTRPASWIRSGRVWTWAPPSAGCARGCWETQGKLCSSTRWGLKPEVPFWLIQRELKGGWVFLRLAFCALVRETPLGSHCPGEAARYQARRSSSELTDSSVYEYTSISSDPSQAMSRFTRDVTCPLWAFWRHASMSNVWRQI